MKPHLRVAAVTSALQALLLPAVHEVSSQGLVQSTAPFDRSKRSRFEGVNVYLFHVERDATLANLDLPTRSAEGRLDQSPIAALDLLYLISFYGDEATMVPEQLLGSVVSTLQQWPILFGDLLQRLADGAPLIAESGLADQGTRVKLVLVPMSIDQIMRLWTVFQVPYVLSIVVRASVVLVETGAARPIAPVRQLGLAVWPSSDPEAHVAAAHAGVGDALQIRGGAVSGRPVRFRMGAATFPPDAVHGDTVSFTLTTERMAQTGLRLGPVAFEMVDARDIRVAEGRFTWVPTVTGVTAQRVREPSQVGAAKLTPDRTVTFTAKVAPPPAPDVAVPVRVASADGSTREVDGTLDRHGNVTCTVAGLTPGGYRLDVRVDGVWSASEAAGPAVVAIP